MSKYIIKGYKGIMDLDLTKVDSKYHKILVEQHMKDIDLYKIEQAKLPPEKRYENTIEKAKNKLEYENRIRYSRLFEKN
tara:strand:+ start:31 stop:267 length:237 start_codon:yes stop_codon:yes gene_type:complete